MLILTNYVNGAQANLHCSSDPNWVCWRLNGFIWILHVTTVTSVLLSWLFAYHCWWHDLEAFPAFQYCSVFSVSKVHWDVAFKVWFSWCSGVHKLCILNVFVFCVFSSHSFFFPFLSLILFGFFCLAQQSSLLDCISQSCISACCNLVPWSNKVPLPMSGTIQLPYLQLDVTCSV